MDKKAKILLIAMAATGVAACNSNDDGEEATQPPVISRPRGDTTKMKVFL